MSMNRRRFLAATGLPALTFGATRAAGARALAAPADADADRTVHLSGDGLGLNPSQYAALLTRLLDEKAMTPDSYSLGGIVEELEDACARMLGKERAIFMPTGTLANHMAVRALAGGSSRVLVQEDSHFYLDEGDCAQTLSNLTLMPLAPGKATFTADEVQHVLDQTKGARVVSRVSVIAVETPVRRKQGEHFDAAELTKIIAIAKREGHPPPPRRRAHLPAGGVHRRERRRLREAVRHGLRLALQVLQRRLGRDPRRAARA